MEVATENTIFGDTSIKVDGFFWNSEVSSRKRPDTLLFTKWPSSSNGSFACATTKLSSSSAVRYTTSSVTRGFAGSVYLQHGMEPSMKPYSFTFA